MLASFWTTHRHRVVVTASLLGATSLALAFMVAPVSAQHPCWSPPVVGHVVDPFRAPPCRWCAGNRGIEYRVAPATAVRAAATGVVVFDGEVAGTRYVVVQLASGWRLTYGELDAESVELGDLVIAGSRLGTASGSFHFGLRTGTGADEQYADPAPYLGTLRYRARLVPVDATPARPAPSGELRCQVGEPRR